MSISWQSSWARSFPQNYRKANVVRRFHSQIQREARAESLSNHRICFGQWFGYRGSNPFWHGIGIWKTLADVSNQGKNVVEEAIQSLWGLFWASLTAHESGIVHRHSSNIMLMTVLFRHQGSIKILDLDCQLSIMKQVRLKRSQRGEIFGSPLYMIWAWRNQSR